MWKKSKGVSKAERRINELRIKEEKTPYDPSITMSN